MRCLLLITSLCMLLFEESNQQSCSCERSPSCFTTILRSRQYTCYASRKVSYAHGRSTTAGWWWGKRRVTRYQQRYRYERYKIVCTRYSYASVCCSGWHYHPVCGRCAKHPNDLDLSFCPGNMTTQTTSGNKAIAHWNAPIFTEYYGCPVTVIGGYSIHMATLSCGNHLITYIGRSKNNNKEKQCKFNVMIDPAPAIPYVVGKSEGETIKTVEGVTLTLVCKVDHGAPNTSLHWYNGNGTYTNNTSFQRSSSGCGGYYTYKSTLQIKFDRGDHAQRLTCEDDRGQQTHVKLSVWYEVDPVIKFCPANKTIITSNIKVTLNLESATFSEPREEALHITCNIRDHTQPQDFGWGHHQVIYTAENLRNLRQAYCSFAIVVKPLPCLYLPSLLDGAMSCGFWEDTFTHICVPMCPRRGNLPYLSPGLFICGASGQWMPQPTSTTCQEYMDESDYKGHSTESQYFTGNCSSPTTEASMKNTFMKIVELSQFRQVCYSTGCENMDIVNIKCGAQV